MMLALRGGLDPSLTQVDSGSGKMDNPQNQAHKEERGDGLSVIKDGSDSGELYNTLEPLLSLHFNHTNFYSKRV